MSLFFFFFSSRRRHTRWPRDWSSDVCSSDLALVAAARPDLVVGGPAFLAGRYGVACGALCAAVQAELKIRSEERRVGKECRCRRSGCHEKKKERRWSVWAGSVQGRRRLKYYL